MRTLLFVDLLGTKARIRTGGIASVVSRIEAFQRLIEAEFQRSAPNQWMAESDSAVALFDDGPSAVRAGANLFRSAFDATSGSNSEPFWLRGSMVPAPMINDTRDLFREGESHDWHTKVPSDVLIEALILEKSGLKGMRLFMAPSVLSQAERVALQRNVAWGSPSVARPVYVSRVLGFATPPQVAHLGAEDVLWMIDDEPYFLTRDTDLRHRMRRAALDPEEYTQAAMTLVVFEEARSIIVGAGRPTRGMYRGAQRATAPAPNGAVSRSTRPPQARP